MRVSYSNSMLAISGLTMGIASYISNTLYDSNLEPQELLATGLVGIVIGTATAFKLNRHSNVEEN